MKRKFAALLVIGTAIISLVCGVFIGRALPKQPEVSFYANVLENADTYLLVEGISENDINHRSQFTVSLKDKDSFVLDINSTSIIKTKRCQDQKSGSSKVDTAISFLPKNVLEL